LEVYYLDNGHYPSSDEGLSALVAKPTDAPNWTGPYLKGAIVPVDPWGHPYEYRAPGEKGPYDLKSEGPGGDNRGIVRSGDAVD
jgi:general secretion pathway protein G